MIEEPKEQNQGQPQGQLTKDEQRDLDKANALRKSLENDATPQAGNLTEGVLTNGGQITVAGTINSEDLATFIKDVFAAQSKIDAEKMTARLTEAHGALQREEGGARVFEASDVYKRLQDYGLVIDPDVFRAEVAKNNARHQILESNRRNAIKLGLPENASLEQIQIEARIRRRVDPVLANLKTSIDSALKNPEDGREGVIRLFDGSNTPQFRLGVDLGEISDAVECPVLTKRTPWQSLLAAIGYYHTSLTTALDPAYANARFTSPAFNELLDGIRQAGAVPVVSLRKAGGGSPQHVYKIPSFIDHVEAEVVVTL